MTRVYKPTANELIRDTRLIEQAIQKAVREATAPRTKAKSAAAPRPTAKRTIR